MLSKMVKDEHKLKKQDILDALNASCAAGEEILVPASIEKRASAPHPAPFYDTEKTNARKMPPLEA